MGQTLSSPVVDKHSAHGEDSRLAYGVSEMQGWRLSMEDAHATVLSLDDPSASHDVPDESVSDKPPTTDINRAFFAVYDGHGGQAVAKYAGNQLHDRLKTCEKFNEKDYPQALKDTFMSIDQDLSEKFVHDPSGCTAVAALIGEDRNIHVANAGDSRAVLSVGGTVRPLSFDHKPNNEDELRRIEAAGGYVDFGRVNGNLALSRALGDFEYKRNTEISAEQQAVTAMPEVTTHESTQEDEFLVLACDGIWDVLSSQSVVDFVRRKIAERQDLDRVCEELMDFCLAPDPDWGGLGCDNMTVLVVALLNGKTKEEWYDWVAQRVQDGVGYATPEAVPSPYQRPEGVGPRNPPVPGIRAFGGGGADPASAGIGGGPGGAGGPPGSLSGLESRLTEVLGGASVLLTPGGGVVPFEPGQDESSGDDTSPTERNIQELDELDDDAVSETDDENAQEKSKSSSSTSMDDESSAPNSTTTTSSTSTTATNASASSDLSNNTVNNNNNNNNTSSTTPNTSTDNNESKSASD